MRTNISLQKECDRHDGCKPLSKMFNRTPPVGLVDFAERLADEYVASSELTKRKARGQFFTPKEVALFMARRFDLSGKKDIRFLDPGAGAGMLTAAFCTYVLTCEGKKTIAIDVYENDPDLIPCLKKTLHHCESALKAKGHEVSYKIIQKDFVVEGPEIVDSGLLFSKQNASRYDCIISNPPYYKVAGNSAEAGSMSELVSGQPNIYTFFMALSLESLNPVGEMVFITPRSFCSGLYFKKFRKWLLDRGAIKSIHLFESRKAVFSKADVLQENVIIKVSPRMLKQRDAKVLMTASKDGLFNDLQEFSVDYEDMLHRKNGDVFIKIPVAEIDVKVQHVINSWVHTLKDFGINASTGPVVSFRAEEFLSSEHRVGKTVPLLWMHNIQGMDAVWPLGRKNKECAIRHGEGIDPCLIPVSNYVLVKRFSSKEQNRRLYAGVMLKSDFAFDRVGIENHLNYIYKIKGTLSLEEVYGIAGILNSSIVDKFFRMMNGSTQVNVTDILNLPLPSFGLIKEIGMFIVRNKPPIGCELDKAVSDILGTQEIFNALYGRS